MSGKAADALLTREALRNVMTACSVARKTAMRQARATNKEGDALNRGGTIDSVHTNLKIDDAENGVGVAEPGDNGCGVVDSSGRQCSLGVSTGGEAGINSGDGCALSGEHIVTTATAIGPPEKFPSLVPGVEEGSSQDLTLESFAHHFRGALASVELGSEVREDLVDAARGLA